MAWYRTGTVALTNGSATVTGSGTAFIANAPIGEAFLGPDGRTYEITDTPSNTSLTISPAYLGSTASGQSYAILPARGRIADLIAETQSLLASFAPVRDGIGAGLFPDGSAATPGFRFTNDQDTGIYRYGTNVIGLSTAGAVRVVVNASGNMGIGIEEPGTYRLNVNKGSQGNIGQFTDGVESTFVIRTESGILQCGQANNLPLALLTNGLERMRIAASGNVGINSTAPATKLEVRGGHADTILQLYAAVGSGNDSYMRLLCSLPGVSFGGGALANNINGLGQAVVNTTFGSSAIHFSEDGSIQLWSGAVANIAAPRLTLAANGSTLRPNTDNVTALGSGSFRFTTVFATTGTINTSDEREKHWRGELNAAELRAAKRIIGELGIYQWNDAVEEKGEDGARLHFGVRAQRAFAIMEDEGLDWGRYAWACYDQWEEQTEPVFAEVTVTKSRKVMRPSTLIDPATGQPAMVEVDEAYEETEMRPTGETRVTLEAGDRYGVRPDQLAFWLIAAQAAIQADLEARLAALEGTA
ncbi:tail fiber domain-containing protein [Blastomonas sp.]|uniref:tail fiber domain-containing protein n=1 Tax=Blastomonas sp. TaxID=1909299 RepID=UPI0017BA0713|nr:hypothetical protein [Blastomonas sp.]